MEIQNFQCYILASYALGAIKVRRDNVTKIQRVGGLTFGAKQARVQDKKRRAAAREEQIQDMDG
jgi:hypothetical protein